MHEAQAASGADRFAPGPDGDLAADQQALRDRLMQRRGRVPAPFEPLLLTPAVGEAFEQWSAALQAGTLSAAVREAVFLAVARLHRCRYLWANHVSKAEQAGLTLEAIAALGTGHVPAQTPDVQAAIALVSELLAHSRVADAVYEQAVAALTTRGVVELTSFCGLAVSVALMLNVRQPPLPAGSDVPF